MKLGLAWSFFVAGVPTIAISQWKVRSDGTADLMIEVSQGIWRAKRRAKVRQYPSRGIA
ncbi:MAG: CHAT domain-containing protein [Acidobacteria bacterium]|nr:CHAT domain-containing protein [Acidobacteriota bacterium]